MYRLVIMSGALQGRRLVIRQGPVILGRHPDSTIRLPDQGVALQHAILEERPDGVVGIRCLAAEARLMVNRRETAAAELRDGDQFELGPVKVQFLHSTSTGAAPRTHRGGLQMLTLAAVAGMLLAQTAFLLWISLWPYRGAVTAANPPEPAAPPPQGTTTAAAPLIAKASPPPAPKPATPAVAKVTPPPHNPTGDAAAVSREIKLMQEEMGQLRQQVAALPKPPAPVPAPPAAAKPVPAPPAAEPDNAVWAQAQRMLQQALAQERALGPEGLDQELEKIQRMAPDFAPTYQHRARLFEQQKQPQAALAQWRELQRHTTQAEWLARARAESKRLAAIAPPPPPAPKPAAPAVAKVIPATPPAPASAPVLRIAAVDQQKFLSNEQFDEMRMLRITLAPRPGTASADPADVNVRVTFYDQDRDTGQVAPTRAVTPSAALHPPEAVTPATQPVLTAAYLLPRGFRENETRQHNGRRRYYGYRVRLYYHGELQDVQARPLDLLAPDTNL